MPTVLAYVANPAVPVHAGGVGPSRLVVFAFLALTGCGQPPGLTQEAPEACGFPDGAALSYAGRSTTAALNVQEVVGDPLSDDPADIYITRDGFDQGDLHGRLVCAIFVDQPGFVEVTVHPADGGRLMPTPTAIPTPLPSGMIEIVTHCGLGFVRIEYDGQVWRFDVGDQPNPPEGWGSFTTAVQLVPSPTGPIVIGPDGSEWPLIRAEPDSTPGICV
jgi:hypothetical protein